MRCLFTKIQVCSVVSLEVKSCWRWLRRDEHGRSFCVAFLADYSTVETRRHCFCCSRRAISGSSTCCSALKRRSRYAVRGQCVESSVSCLCTEHLISEHVANFILKGNRKEILSSFLMEVGRDFFSRNMCFIIHNLHGVAGGLKVRLLVMYVGLM